ncbi:hypothetical protein [Microvirga puerhi]|uniref:Uncharacterized protein n=1 Tax=Microvirga puerhi TaxID=2876078 RepID=A0ABS7VTL8_9HYPH|nr:hypothetical protein [Microvirga puerhi]MBZ6078913.1 hypothetical protein [Microvirga puerhi]
MSDKELVAEWNSNLSFVLDDSLKDALTNLKDIPGLSERVVSHGYVPQAGAWTMPANEREELLTILEKRFTDRLKPLVERAEEILKLADKFRKAPAKDREKVLGEIENYDAQMDYLWRSVFVDARRAARKELSSRIGRDHPDAKRLWEQAEARMFPTEEMKRAQTIYRELQKELEQQNDAAKNDQSGPSNNNPRNSM